MSFPFSKPKEGLLFPFLVSCDHDDIGRSCLYRMPASVSTLMSRYTHYVSNDTLDLGAFQRYLRMVSVSKPIPVMGLVSVARLIHSFVVASSLNTKHTSCTNTCLLVLACTILVDSTQQFASCYGPWRWNIIKIVGRPRRDRGISDSWR